MREIIYNVTVKVDPLIADEWLEWLLKIHIPAILETACFTRYQLLKLLDQDENHGPTFAIQYYAASMEKYQHYLSHFASAFRKDSIQRWGDQIVNFRTVLEIMN